MAKQETNRAVTTPTGLLGYDGAGPGTVAAAVARNKLGLGIPLIPNFPSGQFGTDTTHMFIPFPLEISGVWTAQIIGGKIREVHYPIIWNADSSFVPDILLTCSQTGQTSAVGKVAIYASHATVYKPGARLAVVSSIDWSSSSNMVEKALTGFTPVPGSLYWISVACSVAAVTLTAGAPRMQLIPAGVSSNFSKYNVFYREAETDIANCFPDPMSDVTVSPQWLRNSSINSPIVGFRKT